MILPGLSGSILFLEVGEFGGEPTLKFLNFLVTDIALLVISQPKEGLFAIFIRIPMPKCDHIQH